MITAFKMQIFERQTQRRVPFQLFCLVFMPNYLKYRQNKIMSPWRKIIHYKWTLSFLVFFLKTLTIQKGHIFFFKGIIRNSS